jgi:hypothetical protein
MLPNCKRIFANYIAKSLNKIAQIAAIGARASISCDVPQIFGSALVWSSVKQTVSLRARRMPFTDRKLTVCFTNLGTTKVLLDLANNLAKIRPFLAQP